MNINTTIAKNICVADEKAGYDAACKQVHRISARYWRKIFILE